MKKKKTNWKFYKSPETCALAEAAKRYRPEWIICTECGTRFDMKRIMEAHAEQLEVGKIVKQGRKDSKRIIKSFIEAFDAGENHEKPTGE